MARRDSDLGDEVTQLHSRTSGSGADAGALERFAAAKFVAQTQLRATAPGIPVRLAKPTSNLFRPREAVRGRLGVQGLSGVLAVDTGARTADVAGMTTYEQLVAALLPYGFMPLVVPQLKTITLGGAVAGLGIESTSFRSGLPHESVVEMEILTGGGDLVVATGDGEHADLYHAFPNSYGTLGYALRLRIELEPVHPYVRLRHLRYDTAESLLADLDRACTDRDFNGERVDFCDATVFSADAQYLTLGAFTDESGPVSDYTGMDIYYRSIRQRDSDRLTIRDYLWRWDTDWFWCSRAFGAQHPLVRRLWPKRWLRSDVYWKLVALDRRLGLSRRFDQLRGFQSELVIQDVEIPVSQTAEFLDFLHREVGISPVWLCPLRQRAPRGTWSLYDLDPAVTYVNLGFWSGVRLPGGATEGHYNRRIERVVDELGGRKSLYSTSFYPPEEFWVRYGGDVYHAVKRRYDPQDRLLDLYEKCVRRR